MRHMRSSSMTELSLTRFTEIKEFLRKDFKSAEDSQTKHIWARIPYRKLM